MKKIKLLIVAAAALISGSAMAQKMSCPDAILEDGQANLVISIADNTDATATSAQFVLSMPEGITVEKNSKNRYVFQKGELMQEDHTVTFQDKANGDILFVTSNMYGEEFTAVNGELISFKVVASESLEDGTYQIQVKDVNIVNLAAQKIAKETSFIINVTKGSTGIKEVDAEGASKGTFKYVDKNGNLVIKAAGKEFNAIGGRTK